MTSDGRSSAVSVLFHEHSHVGMPEHVGNDTERHTFVDQVTGG